MSKNSIIQRLSIDNVRAVYVVPDYFGL
jgi:hypothetical protein